MTISVSFVPAARPVICRVFVPSPIETAPKVLVNVFPANPAYLFVRFALASYPATPDAVVALDLYPMKWNLNHSQQSFYL